MLKKRLRSLKVAFQHSRHTPAQTIFKSILLTAVCFCCFKPCAKAQKYNLDQRILINMMENRSEGTTRLMKGISNNTQLVSVLIPASVVVAGLLDNNKSTLKKGLYLAESAAAATFISYGMKYSFKRSRPYMAM